MEILKDNASIEFMNMAIEVAKKATCLRSKCGAILVKDNRVIGEGFNSPSGNLESQRRCLNDKDLLNKKVTDKTCCIHAEERAIMDVLKKNPEKIRGSVLYFIRLDLEDNKLFAGKPYCTMCSKMALDIGVKNFVLWHKEGITSYETEEYNDLSYSYDS